MRHDAGVLILIVAAFPSRSPRYIVEPFAILLADIDLRRKVPGTGPTELNKKLFQFANVRADEAGSKALLDVYEPLSHLLEYTQELRSYELGEQTLVLGKTSPQWREVFGRTVTPSLKELDYTMNTYRSVMDVSCISAVEHLRSIWLVKRLERIPEEASPKDSIDDFLHLTDALKGVSVSIYSTFLTAAEAAHRVCLDKLV